MSHAILVVGGAGYIGSHTAKLLKSQGHQAVILDDLSTGHRGAVTKAVGESPFYHGKYGDSALVERILKEHAVDAVMHFGAKALIGESIEKPLYYYEENVAGAVGLLKGMVSAGVRKIIFSSTCATFGNPKTIPIHEDVPQSPINPYGRSKLFVEQILRDAVHSHGLQIGILRYFNAAGADPDGSLGEDHEPETHLIPNILKAALGLNEKLVINGNDYATPDGSCIRDYVHVCDLAEAHSKLFQKMLDEKKNFEFNLGSGKGHSILEIVEAAKRVTGKSIPSTVGPRRVGDPPALVADSKRSFSTLKWIPRFDLNGIIETAWNWMRVNPKGYRD